MNPAQNYLGGLTEALRQDGAMLDESISALRREITRLSNRHDSNMQNLVAKTQRQTQLLSFPLLPHPFSGLCSENATQSRKVDDQVTSKDMRYVVTLNCDLNWNSKCHLSTIQ